MDNKFVYWDDIYTNGKGRYCTEQNLINNFYKQQKLGNKDIYVSKYDENDVYVKVENPHEELSGKTVRCNYAQLFSDNDSLLLCNNIPQVDAYLFDNVEGGELCEYYNEDGDEITREEYEELGWEHATEQYRDIYQYYLINESLAHMLINHTDNLVFYSDALDLYVLGVTHFGTGWSCVDEDFVW